MRQTRGPFSPLPRRHLIPVIPARCSFYVTTRKMPPSHPLLPSGNTGPSVQPPQPAGLRETETASSVAEGVRTRMLPCSQIPVR